MRASIFEAVRDRRPSALPFVLAKVTLGGLHQCFPRRLVVAAEYLIHPEAIAEEPPVRGELDLARVLIFCVLEHDPVSDAAVVATVERGNAALRPDSVTDLHHLRFERAGNVDVRRVVMAFDESYARRIALNAMTRAAAEPVTGMAGLRRYAPKVSLLLHVPFVAVRPHPRTVHDRALVDALGVQKVQLVFGQVRHPLSPGDHISIRGCSAMS